jgi:hypothetical protein
MEWFVEALKAGWLPGTGVEITDGEGAVVTHVGWKEKQQTAINKVVARERGRADTLETDLSVVTAERDTLKAGAKEGDADKVLIAENEKLTAQLGVKDERIIGLEGTAKDLRFGNVTRDLTQAATVAGFGDPADAVVHLVDYLSSGGKVLDEAGKTRINGDGDEMTIKELVVELAEAKPYLLKKSLRKGTNFSDADDEKKKTGDLDTQILEAEKGTTRADAVRSIGLKQQRQKERLAKR